MAIHQYIGARYVPKFFENPDGTNNWIDSVPYEPLTIVTYLGNTYTSKKAVPPHVDIDNHEYWVLTGNYNQQIDEYRAEVEELNDKVNSYINKPKYNIIMIGDSYGEQRGTSNITKWYWEYFRDTLGLDDNTFHSSMASGAGFGNGSYLSQLTAIYNTLLNPEEITDIIVCGGWNDSDKSQSYGTDERYNQGADAFTNYAKQNFPNARLNVAHISWGNPSISSVVHSQMPVSIERYNNLSGRGWRVLTGCENILHIYRPNVWQSDGTHPSQLGQSYLGLYLPTAFLNGNVNVRYGKNTRSLAKAHANVTTITNSNDAVSEMLIGDTCYLTFFKHDVYLTMSGLNMTLNGNSLYAFFGTDFTLVSGIGAEVCIGNTAVTIYTGSEWLDCDASVYLVNNLIGLRITKYGSSGALSVSPQYMWIRPFNAVIPSIEC